MSLDKSLEVPGGVHIGPRLVGLSLEVGDLGRGVQHPSGGAVALEDPSVGGPNSRFLAIHYIDPTL